MKNKPENGDWDEENNESIQSVMTNAINDVYHAFALVFDAIRDVYSLYIREPVLWAEETLFVWDIIDPETGRIESKGHTWREIDDLEVDEESRRMVFVIAHWLRLFIDRQNQS